MRRAQTLLRKNVALLKLGFLFFILFLPGVIAYASDYSVVTKPNDKRQYRYFLLANGIKVLLISDSQAEKASVALDVKAGSGNDPDDRQGLAHFLEHMLFLGTEKYPQADEYQNFISGHGGSHNAFTSLEHTNYFFDIKLSYLEPALDRFAQFFISPKFDSAYIERERQAVHSEYRSKVKSHFRRLKDVWSEIIDPKHVLSKFSVGNLETLSISKPRSLRQDLIAFYETYYRPENMTLVINSNKSLHDMESLVQQKFAKIKALPERPNATNPESESIPLFSSEGLPAILHIKPLREIRKVSFTFPVPSTRKHYKKKPLIFISHFLGHEGEGSLLSVLKAKGWALNLSAGQLFRWQDGEIFDISIELTEEGLEHIETIEYLLFKTVSLVKDGALKKWRYRELKKLSDVEFRFGDRTPALSEVSRLAGRMQIIPAKDILREGYLFEQFDKGLIESYLAYLSPSNMVKVVTTPQIKTERISNLYGVEYKFALRHDATEGVAEDKTLKKLSRKLKLPKKNKFIPNRFDIKGLAEDSSRKALPTKIVEQPGLDVWFLNDDRYDLPLGYIHSQYRMPEVEKSATAYIAAKIYTMMIQEYLNETSYSALMGGLQYGLSANMRGVDLNFYGYDDSLSELVNIVSSTLHRYNKDPDFRQKLEDEKFSIMKKRLERSEKNKAFDKPYVQLLRDVPALTYQPYWSFGEITAALKAFDLSKYRQLTNTLYQGSSLKAFVFGNFNKRNAKRYVKKLSTVMPKIVSEASHKLVSKKAKVANTNVLNKSASKVLSIKHQDHALALYAQGSAADERTMAKVQVMQQLIAAPFYNSLRTEKQLGYIVFFSAYPIRKVPGIIAVVQSPDREPDEILEEYQKFFVDAESEIFKNFERGKRAIMAELTETPKSQAEQADYFWEAILNDDERFDEKQRLRRAVELLKKNDVRTLYQDMFIKNKKWLLLTTSNKRIPFVHVGDYHRFKSSLPHYSFP